MKNEFKNRDALYPKVKAFAKKTKDLKSWKIQEKFKTGYIRTAGLMDMLKADPTVKLHMGKIPSRINLEKIYTDKDWKNFKGKATIPIGAETPSDYKIGTLANAFNLILGGATGSGKSTFIHCAIVHLLKNLKKDIQFILIDPKRVELSLYEKLPNLLFPVAYENEKAKEVLKWCMKEIKRRSDIVATKKKEKFSNILVVIDEFSDLMMYDSKFFNRAVKEISKKGYLVGVNILIATSRLSKDVYPKKLVDSFGYRIAFATPTNEGSKVLLESESATELKGRGDLLMSESELPILELHLQGFYVSEKEVRDIVKSMAGNEKK